MKIKEVLLKIVSPLIAPTYNKYIFKKVDRAVICGDTHIPFHDHKILNLLIQVARQQKIKTLFIGGDLTDQKTVSRYLIRQPHTTTKLNEEIIELKNVLEVLFKTFNKIYLIAGDHDERLLKKLSFELNWTTFIESIEKQLVVAGKLEASDYMFAVIKSGNLEWRITHPLRATKRPTTKSLQIASITEQNIIMTHGHTFGMEFVPSGRYLAVNLGCMTDPLKQEYICLRDTGYSKWRRQFATLENGKITIYDEGEQLTDWSKIIASRKKKNES